MKNIFESGKYYAGCNYWASEHGINMWNKWNEDTVKNDFEKLSSLGIKVVRAFPLWSDFQPIDTVCTVRGNVTGFSVDNGETMLTSFDDGIDEEMVLRFIKMLDIAHSKGISVIPSLLTGWMSGRLFVPPALNGKNLITDPFCMKWEVIFLKGMVNRLKNHPAIVGWCIGNECNCMGAVENKYQAWLWTNQMSDAIKSQDNTRPVLQGMHSLLNPDEGNWILQDGGLSCDILTTHPYASPSYDTDKEIINTIRPLLHPVSQTIYYRGLGQKPALIEETGTFGEMYCNEELTAKYAKAEMFGGWAHNLLNYIWWIGFDQGSLTYYPFLTNNRASNYGLFREDGSVKPVGSAMKEFNQWLDKFPYDKLPERIVDAVCISPREKGNYTHASSMAFLLGKQAGLDMEFVYSPDSLPDAKAYIIPSLNGALGMDAHYLKRLMKKVEDGAVLYLSCGDGFIRNMSKDFGFEIISRHHTATTDKITIGDTTLDIFGKIVYDIKKTTAKSLATNQNGEDVYLEADYGKGKVMLFMYPVEEYLSNVFNKFELGYHKIYEAIKNNIKSDKVAVLNDFMSGMTEHIVNDNERILIITNYSGKDKEISVTIPSEWKMKESLRGNVTESGNELKFSIDSADTVVVTIEK